MLPSSPSAAAPEPRRLPNGPSFAGDACPTAGLWSCGRASVLLSTSIAWWTENREVRAGGWGTRNVVPYPPKPGRGPGRYTPHPPG